MTPGNHPYPEDVHTPETEMFDRGPSGNPDEKIRKSGEVAGAMKVQKSSFTMPKVTPD